MKLRETLWRNTTVQMLGYAVSLAVGMLTTTLLSRYLGVEEYGRFNYVLVFFYFFLMLNDFGVNTIAVREISAAPAKAEIILGTVLCFKILMAIVSLGAAWWMISQLHFDSIFMLALKEYALILPLTALQMPALIFQVRLDFRTPVTIGIAVKLFGLFLMLTAIHLRLGLLWLIASLVVTEFLCTILLLSAALKIIKPIFRIQKEILGKILKSSATLGAVGLLVAAVNRIDFLMLERMTDLRQLGFYSAAYRVTNILEAFPTLIMSTIYPVMSLRFSQNDSKDLERIYKKTLLLLAGTALPVVIFITLFSSLIIGILFGDEYEAAAKGLRILVWATAFIYMAIASGNLLVSTSREKINFWIYLAATGLNVGLNYLFIPTGGFYAASWTTVISYGFIFFVQSFFAWRLLQKLKEKPLSHNHLI